jgi:Family of unknown function (DUF5985)
MSDPRIGAFLVGLITAGYLACGLFFFRFWWRGRDFLFAAFAAAFWLLALDAALVEVVEGPDVRTSWFHLLRVAAFVLIAIAVVAKNAGNTDENVQDWDSQT